MATTSPFPAPLRGTLQLYQKEPVALPYFDTDAALPHSLVFVPGLTNTIGTLPYLPRLAESIRSHGYSLVQPQLTSNLGGYGQCTLEGDAQEIAACVSHLRRLPPKRHRKVVLMGHSTGCQDSIAYLLSSERAADPLTRIDGAILQAPVSDREYYEHERNSAPSDQIREEMDRELEHATQLFRSGQGAALIPRKDAASIELPTDPLDPPHAEDRSSNSRSSSTTGNASAVLAAAMTAYRTWSLKAKGGHDDFFSTDLQDAQITASEPGARTIGRAVKNLQAGAGSTKPRILALIGEKDEFVPAGFAGVLLSRWNELLGASGGFQAAMLQQANHQAADPVAIQHLLQLVGGFLEALV